MNIALFGGTFDPIHRGHLAVARAAREQFELGKVLFVPTGAPPHKQRNLAPFEHRYAMVALATQGEKAFVPSLLEAPQHEMNDVAPARSPGHAPSHSPRRKGHHDHAVAAGSSSAAAYSIDTVRRLKQQLRKADKLYFLIGIDAFLDIATWRRPEELLREVEFIIASRPGSSLADVAAALPESLRPSAAARKPFHNQPAQGSIVLPGATLHLLDTVHEDVSATAIRAAAQGKRPLEKYVGPAVAGYIKKQGLYL
ncbi:MAG TPA: nicotinate-nicotinamide nucleotide adenylyltransferase [Terriglobales bacterium]|nr:nicotinate-nicotinamide nucleotide adenylyltransferase [Terriglobales bacterium]